MAATPSTSAVLLPVRLPVPVAMQGMSSRYVDIYIYILYIHIDTYKFISCSTTRRQYATKCDIIHVYKYDDYTDTCIYIYITYAFTESLQPEFRFRDLGVANAQSKAYPSVAKTGVHIQVDWENLSNWTTMN